VPVPRGIERLTPLRGRPCVREHVEAMHAGRVAKSRPATATRCRLAVASAALVS
jgi:hypothetical protein